MLVMAGKTYDRNCQKCGVFFVARQANRKFCDEHSANVQHRGRDSRNTPRCQRCHGPISAARLRAMPRTDLCVECKALCDEPPISVNAPVMRGSLAESSLSDLAELAKAARDIGRGE